MQPSYCNRTDSKISLNRVTTAINQEFIFAKLNQCCYQAIQSPKKNLPLNGFTILLELTWHDTKDYNQNSLILSPPNLPHLHCFSTP